MKEATVTSSMSSPCNLSPKVEGELHEGYSWIQQNEDTEI